MSLQTAAESNAGDTWQQRLTGHGLFLASSLFMASNALFGRAAAEVIPPVGLAFWRWLLAFLIILPFAARGLWTHRQLLLAAAPRLLMLGVLAMGFCGANVYIGLHETTATNVGLIYALSPVLIVLLARLVDGEPTTKRQVCGITMAFIGVLAILVHGDPAALAALEFNHGDLWILSGAVAWAIYTWLLRRWKLPIPIMTMFAANALAGVVVLAPFYLWEIARGEAIPLSVKAAFLVSDIAIFASVLSFLTYQKTIQLVGPSRAGLAMYVVPLWTAGLGALLLDETLHLYHMIGAVTLLTGVALATIPGKSAPAAPPAASPPTASPALTASRQDA